MVSDARLCNVKKPADPDRYETEGIPTYIDVLIFKCL